MAKNRNLAIAKAVKNDEFYTQLTDIEEELSNYEDSLKNQVVYCNCDNPEWSNFYRYFDDNFDHLGLKTLIATYYDLQSRPYKTEIRRDAVTGERLPPLKTYLQGNGDFASFECVSLLQECDVVITNPPFSLFREYIAQLVRGNKKFLCIGNINAITYKEIFPLLQDNKMWLGYTHPKQFVMPDGAKKAFGNILWYTNIDIAKRHEPLILSRRFADEPNRYPRYDNYDAINVDRVQDIPEDYHGAMGVPISFLDKYCPEQFEILGLSSTIGVAVPKDTPKNLRGGPRFYLRDSVTGRICRRCYERIVIRRRNIS